MENNTQILKQYNKAFNARCKADRECDVLFIKVRPFLCKEWQNNASVIDQGRDGIVLLVYDTNYPIMGVIDAIQRGIRNIGSNDLTAI